jgi:hypothetical protein
VTQSWLSRALDAENPDFVVFTGDQVSQVFLLSMNLS